jgi:hypothetical protein
MENLTSIISTVGFPIASFLISAYFIKYCYDKQIEKDKQTDEREDRHWEEISKLTTAVNNNTEVLRDFVSNAIKSSGSDGK